MATPEISRPEKHRGFPSPKKESRLYHDFIRFYAEPIADYTRVRLPDWRPTRNQLFLLSMIYYGIYFYDSVCGGDLLSGRTTANDQARQYRQRHNLPACPPDCGAIGAAVTNPDNGADLSLWPVNLSYGRPGAVPGAYYHGMISIPASFLPDVNPREEFFYAYRYFQNPLLKCLHQLFFENKSHYLSRPLLQRGILTGLEEAQHSHFWYLERVHYGNDHGNVNTVYGPLKNYLTKRALANGGGLNHHLRYYSGSGAEFAAHVTKAAYVRKYRPEIWYSGYYEFHQAVKTTRRQLAASSPPATRPCPNRGGCREDAEPRG